MPVWVNAKPEIFIGTLKQNVFIVVGYTDTRRVRTTFRPSTTMFAGLPTFCPRQRYRDSSCLTAYCLPILQRPAFRWWPTRRPMPPDYAYDLHFWQHYALSTSDDPGNAKWKQRSSCGSFLSLHPKVCTAGSIVLQQMRPIRDVGVLPGG
jgi:hypothetical protein